MKQDLLILPEHSGSPTALVVFVCSFLCSVLNIIVCPFVLFILSFEINFFYFHQSLLNTALSNGSAGFQVMDELNTTNSTYSNTKAHPQKMAQPGAAQTSMTCYFYMKTNFLMDSFIFLIFSLRVVVGRFLVITANPIKHLPLFFPCSNYASIYMLRFYI